MIGLAAASIALKVANLVRRSIPKKVLENSDPWDDLEG